jgi:hypothetical protein
MPLAQALRAAACAFSDLGLLSHPQCNLGLDGGKLIL